MCAIIVHVPLSESQYPVRVIFLVAVLVMNEYRPISHRHVSAGQVDRQFFRTELIVVISQTNVVLAFKENLSIHSSICLSSASRDGRDRPTENG